MSVDKLSPGPACDPKKLFIEVTGLDHGTEHSIQFYDDKDAVQQEFLENKLEVESLEDTCINSWDWNEQKTPINAWLAITADSGVIKLPLFTDIQAKKRVDGEQDYLLHAVMPLTLLPTYDTSLTAKERLAPVRNGYIYVFYNNKAWREIEIRTQDDGSVNLKDIDLYQYRQGRDKPFLDEKRIAVGLPLKEIWLPAKDNKNGTRIHLAYSEVQWSSARLNALEKDSGKLTTRLVAFNSINIDGSVDLLHAASLPEMRARAPEVELSVAHPITLNRDLSGKYASALYQDIELEQERLQKGGDSALQVFKDNNELRFEYGAREHVLRSLIQGRNDPFVQLTSTPDYLDDAKARKLRVLPLTDMIFILKHHGSLTLLASGYLQQVQLSASKNKHFHSAELVQRLVLPNKIGETENQLHEHKDDVNTNLGGVFHRTIRTIERQLFRTDFNLLQQALASVLDDPSFAIALLDLTSMSGVNGGAGHTVVSDALSALSLDADKLDTLLAVEERQNHTSINTLVNIHDSKARHPLHPLLFIPKDKVPLDDVYVPPEADNDGSGLATPANIARWSSDNLLVDESQLESIDLNTIFASADNSEGSFGNYRRISSVVDGILKGFFTSLFTIQSAINSGAVNIEFTALYVNSLSTLKAINAKFLATMTFVPVTGIPLKGYVVGVMGAGITYGVPEGNSTYKYGKRAAPVAYGSLYDDGGNLIASTNKKDFPKNAKLEKVKSRVVMIDEGSDLAMSKAEAQRALNNTGDGSKNLSNVYEKLRVPYIISVIEVINLVTTINAIKTENNGWKNVANIGSAIADLSIALVHAANMMSHNASVLAKASQVNTFNFSPMTVAKFSTPNARFKLVSSVSRLNVAGFVAGMLTAVICLWDAARLYSNQDKDAAFAMGMVAIGTGLSSFASTFIASSSTFLGLGPIAWLGIAIAIGGGLLYYYFKDSPIETWLKNGPFGASPATSGDYASLQQPQQALSQFINLIMSVSITVYPLDKVKIGPDTRAVLADKGVTHGIMLRSNLLQLLNADKIKVRFFARQAIAKTIKQVRRYGNSHSVEIINVDTINSTVIDSVTSAEGRVYFVVFDKKLPKDGMDNSWFKMTRPDFYTHQPHFMVRAQIEVDGQAFPALPINELNVLADPQAAPAFNEQDRYWADELNYPLPRPS
ncbi:hypothetical protein FM037_14765 [Shewanella psychropiezotolerans]|uniref:TcdA/TcdB toxin pore forming domain-containing protein n=1 Tax=Shewanella psychropiezotolerans TaxID=2593655 RepID=A0ABX5WYU2_9GAMM|nr:toxin VasX [Shewanella psychropiezotolerans]QDO84264.1 hypothetical protein FM037_14765 [Shewanella psychropiezotolerans]